jgi:hypothetical protein
MCADPESRTLRFACERARYSEVEIRIVDGEQPAAEPLTEAPQTTVPMTTDRAQEIAERIGHLKEAVAGYQGAMAGMATSARIAFEHALRGGEELRTIKALLQNHGGWGKWLKEHFPLSDRTARVWMQLADAKNKPKLEAKWQATAKMTIEDALAVIADGKVKKMPKLHEKEEPNEPLRPKIALLPKPAMAPDQRRVDVRLKPASDYQPARAATINPRHIPIPDGAETPIEAAGMEIEADIEGLEDMCALARDDAKRLATNHNAQQLKEYLEEFISHIKGIITTREGYH